MGMVNIKGLDKAKVLKALWDNSHAQGLSFLGLTPGGFTLERAQELIKEREDKGCKLYFDYVDGHVIKCDITGDSFEEWLYDRDCGPGTAEAAINELRECTAIKENVIKTASEIEYGNTMKARVKISFDAYTNKNMRALRDVLSTMSSSAHCAFESSKGILIDPPYYMAYEVGDKCYTILKLDTFTQFTVKLPSIPAERDSDMFTISPDTFLPTNVCVYMREDDDVLNMPDMSHLMVKHINDVNELLEYIKQRVSNYNNTNPMFNHTIYTHDKYVCVNRDAVSIIKKDKQKPETASNDICILEKNDIEGEKK